MTTSPLPPDGLPVEPADELEDDPFEPTPSAILHLPLNQQHFHTFLAVVDAGGKLSAGAREIGMSQPGITHQLNELERRLNVQLLDRARGRAARLTRPGRIFERYARNIVALQASMYSDLEQMSRRLGGHMRVGSSPGPGEHWLPPLLCAFREQYPDLQIELHIADARSIVEQVFDNSIELGFVGGGWTRAGLQFEAMAHDEFVMIASPKHPFAGVSEVRMRDLAGLDFIAHEPGTGLRAALEQALGDRGYQLSHFKVLAELGNQESVKSAVAAGYGIGVVWRGSVEAELAVGTLVSLDVVGFELGSDFQVVRRAHRRLSRRSAALIEHLRRARDDSDEVRRSVARELADSPADDSADEPLP
ncbi:MAG: LysR family transcriptional regulator [Thermoleophilia bacterium]|nr:LysR family transcriptional regulator [Thermoleophilia bacterium]